MDFYIDQKVKFQSKNEGYFVQAQATYYPSFIRVFIPKHTTTKEVRKFDGAGSLDPSVELSKKDKETDLERSLRRSRKKVKDIILCNQFNHFVTLTMKTDRQNIMHSKAKVADWIKNEKKRKGKFQYILVPEFHKDKKALHFHALMRGYRGKVVPVINPKTGKHLRKTGRLVYDYPSYTNGHSYINIIDLNPDTPSKLGYYLQKYITKDMPILFGKNRYWSSRGLRRPPTEDNPDLWYKIVEPQRHYENDFGVILEFDVGKHLIVDTYLETKWPSPDKLIIPNS